jgi:hypothetical protein
VAKNGNPAPGKPPQGTPPADRDPHLVFIINSEVPYRYDLNQILALPPGFRYRNRFNMQWVQPELHDTLNEKIGMRTLLVFRDMDNCHLVPARWATIVDVNTIGHIAYFEYILGPLIKFPSDAQVRRQEVLARTQRLVQLHAWLPGHAGQPLLDPSVFQSVAGHSLPTVDTDELNAWGDTVSAVAAAPAFEGIEFLKVVGLEDDKGAPTPTAGEGFRVEEGREYKLKIFQYMPNPGAVAVQSHPIECKTFAESVVPLRERQQAVGKYDMLTFPLHVRSLEAGTTTSLEIPHRPDAAFSGSADGTLYIPLSRASHGRLRAVTAVIVSVVAAMLVLFPSRVDFAGVDPDFVQSLAMIVFVVTIAGPAQSLQAFWPTWPFGGSR